jgi:ribosomal protein S18 acetylase RimI-like enzyme
VIRVGRRGDLAAVLALWEASASTTSSTDDLPGLEALLARDPEALLVAERDGRIVGTLVAGFDGWRGAMYRIVVAEETRREGAGLELVRAGEERLRALGARRVTAQVVAADSVARAFWERAGYVHDAEMARFVKPL